MHGLFCQTTSLEEVNDKLVRRKLYTKIIIKAVEYWIEHKGKDLYKNCEVVPLSTYASIVGILSKTLQKSQTNTKKRHNIGKSVGRKR